MATIDLGTPASGKKALDANIPLIPFIDLLLCCIMFLLVTAVWNQLASHNAVQHVPGQESADQPPPDVLRLVLQVEHAGYVVASTAGERFVIPKRGAAYDIDGLRERLAGYRATDPDRRELTIASEDGVRFEAIIEAMDAARGEGFSGMALSGS